MTREQCIVLAAEAMVEHRELEEAEDKLFRSNGVCVDAEKRAEWECKMVDWTLEHIRLEDNLKKQVKVAEKPYKQWKACTRASNRLADMVCMMYHPKDELARKVFPTATWAELIASELGIEIPYEEEVR